MNFASMTTKQLVDLIASASAEISTRFGEARVKADRSASLRAVNAAAEPREPAEEDKVFALQVKAIATSGGYISAEERSRVAEIAEEFGEWVARQGLPTDRGTGSWRKLAERSRIKPAMERKRISRK